MSALFFEEMFEAEMKGVRQKNVFLCILKYSVFSLEIKKIKAFCLVVILESVCVCVCVRVCVMNLLTVCSTLNCFGLGAEWRGIDRQCCYDRGNTCNAEPFKRAHPVQKLNLSGWH